LPQAQNIELDGEFEAYGVADEIFVKSKPILGYPNKINHK